MPATGKSMPPPPAPPHSRHAAASASAAIVPGCFSAPRERRTRNIFSACQYLVVWSVKYRRKALIDGIETRLREIITAEAERLDAVVTDMIVMTDCVTLVVDIDPLVGIHRTVKTLKSVSSRILRSEFPTLKTRIPSLWNQSYFVTTAAVAPEQLFQAYMAQQKQT